MSDQLVGCQGGCHVPRSELRDVELVVGRQGLVGRVHVCRGCATALVSSRHRVPPELTRLMTDAPGRGREPK